MSEFLSLSTWPLVSTISVIGGPQLTPPLVERLTSIALAPKPPSERSGWNARRHEVGGAVGREADPGVGCPSVKAAAPLHKRRARDQHLGPGPAAVLAVGRDVAPRAAVRPAVLLPAGDQVRGVGRVDIDPGLDLGVGVVHAGRTDRLADELLQNHIIGGAAGERARTRGDRNEPAELGGHGGGPDAAAGHNRAYCQSRCGARAWSGHRSSPLPHVLGAARQCTLGWRMHNRKSLFHHEPSAASRKASVTVDSKVDSRIVLVASGAATS